MSIRLETLRVGDVMSPAPYCLPLDAVLGCALKVLGELRLSGAPVLDEHGAVVGVISTSDLLGPVERLVAGTLPPGELADLPVGSLATMPALTISPEAPLLEACRTMCRTGVHRLVVVNGQGAPVGVITSWDAAAAFGRLAEAEPEPVTPSRSW